MTPAAFMRSRLRNLLVPEFAKWGAHENKALWQTKFDRTTVVDTTKLNSLALKAHCSEARIASFTSGSYDPRGCERPAR